MITIDISLNNANLYEGCAIEEVAGRLNLTTPPVDAVGIIGKNINKIIEAIDLKNEPYVTLTGGMAIWAYLIVFHAVVHRFNHVYFWDGKSEALLVAAHGA